MVALGPVVPFVNVEVGAADTGEQYPNQDIIDSDLRFGRFFEPETAFRPAFDESFHAVSGAISGKAAQTQAHSHGRTSVVASHSVACERVPCGRVNGFLNLISSVS